MRREWVTAWGLHPWRLPRGGDAGVVWKDGFTRRTKGAASGGQEGQRRPREQHVTFRHRPRAGTVRDLKPHPSREASICKRRGTCSGLACVFIWSKNGSGALVISSSPSKAARGQVLTEGMARAGLGQRPSQLAGGRPVGVSTKAGLSFRASKWLS